MKIDNIAEFNHTTIYFVIIKSKESIRNIYGREYTHEDTSKMNSNVLAHSYKISKNL